MTLTWLASSTFSSTTKPSRAFGNLQNTATLPNIPTPSFNAPASCSILITSRGLTSKLRLYARSLKYGIIGLQQLAIKNFSTILDNYYVGRNKSDDRVIIDLLAITAYVYKILPKDDRILRDVIITCIQTNWSHVSTIEAFQDFAADSPSVMIDIVQTTMGPAKGFMMEVRTQDDTCR